MASSRMPQRRSVAAHPVRLDLCSGEPYLLWASRWFTGLVTGHVFVVRGDLTKLACDALLVPTAAQLDVTEHWRAVLESSRIGRTWSNGWLEVKVDAPADWSSGCRAFQVPEASHGRAVWLVQTGGGSPAWVAEGVADAVERIVDAGIAPGRGRDRALIGLPLPGVGAGGLGRERGSTIKALLPRLTQLADRHGVDLALVLFDGRDFAAVQRERVAPPSLGADLDREATRLGELAAAGELVLFLGSGISVSAGLPTWSALLHELADHVGRPRTALDRLPAVDAAQVIARLMKDKFPAYMQAKFTLVVNSLGHALAASLDVECAVTTNYDNGYELAMARRELKVLPRQRATPGTPWLLKMHGDVHDPASIVLTRDHYVEYTNNRTPLVGMVQALLMTRHLLFVGFSMIDDNFARLAHQVRKVLVPSTQDGGRIGTVLQLQADAVREELWKDDLHHLSMAEEAAADSIAARQLEIFLDRVVWEAARASRGSERYLLDDRYAGMAWSDSERALRDRLVALSRDVTPAERGTRAWQTVRAALRQLGADD